MRSLRVVSALCLAGLTAARLVELHNTLDSEETTRELRARHGRSKGYAYCDAPVAKAKVEFPESLAGRVNTSKFDSYSGYVNVTEEDWLFYWFFEASEAAPADAPLIIWTNGGPGCSAMEAATTEHGPWVLKDIKESNMLATGQLSENPYAWNNYGPVLYLDNPRYVGNSFGYGPKVTSSVEAANDVVTFIQGWYSLFPEYADRRVVVAGESYGGHYIPAWTEAILDHNEGNPQVPIPLAGAMIGNGCINNTIQGTDVLVDFMHDNSLISADQNPRTQATAWAEMVQHLGYTPNFYDFRVRNVECSQACYSYNYTEWSLWFLKQEVMDALNVCGQAGYDAFAGSAGGCISLPGFDSGDTFDYSGALGRALDAGIQTLFYFGKTDLACNANGGFAVASTLPWSGSEDFRNAPMEPLGMGSQVQEHGALTFVQVDAAGHMVPLDQPEAAADALTLYFSKFQNGAAQT